MQNNELPEYLTTQLITCLGNKRSLLFFIHQAIKKVLKRLGKSSSTFHSLVTFDAFSGSGVVARFLKKYSSVLYVCDLEKYSEVINLCYLANTSSIDLPQLQFLHHKMTSCLAQKPLRENGIFQRLYAPYDDANIRENERVFYTSRNARFLDTARTMIARVPTELQPFFLGPLLSEASIHVNTAGVFKGFYKNKELNIGQFGGRNKNALDRIMAPIDIPFPLFSLFESEVHVKRGDTNSIAAGIKQLDLAYLDPPYNQHPYGSNYFMLNLLVDYCEPQNISSVSGIPIDWLRSDYNSRSKAKKALEKLVEDLNAKFILISFNSEGFLSQKTMKELLKKYGKLEILRTDYPAFRGARTSPQRKKPLTEFLYLLEK